MSPTTPVTVTIKARPPHVREARLEAHFFQKVRLMGGMAIKLAPTVKGLPDRLVLMPGGHMFLVELKTDAGQLSPAQRRWHQVIERQFGIKVDVVVGMEGITAWLRAVVSRNDPEPRKPGRPRKTKEVTP